MAILPFLQVDSKKLGTSLFSTVAMILTVQTEISFNTSERKRGKKKKKKGTNLFS